MHAARAVTGNFRIETVGGLTNGRPVWTRKAVYTYSGRSVDAHETWLHYLIDHFEPTPAMLTDYEKESIINFRWWTSDELRATQESIFPPNLGDHFAQLQANGYPTSPINIGAAQRAP